MKVFWAFIAILVLTAAVMALRPSGDAKPERTAHAPTPTAAASRPAPSAPSTPPVTDPAPIPVPAAPTTPPAPTTMAAAPDPAPTPAEPAEVSPFGTPVPSSPEPDVAAASIPGQAPAPADPELPDVLQKLVTDTMTPAAPAPASEAPSTEAPAPAAETPAAAAVTEPSSELTTEAAVTTEAAPASAAPLPATTIVKQADGSQLIDDRFILRGDGTKEKPYEVTWDFLVAAQEVYKPRLGQKTLPGYLEIIDGSYVKIAGYIAFPLMAQSPDEMLMMLNQWDGCCIGIPPTPYDAIEVRLRDAAEGDTRFKVTGSLVGKIAVDPYLVKDWLIGLYTMDDAVLTTEN